MCKVLGYRGGDLQKGRIRNGGNAINVVMVIVHELQMLNKRAEAVPSGKRWCIDQQPRQLAVIADIGVYRAGNFAEIFGPVRRPSIAVRFLKALIAHH